ncbi:MAG: trypsin-like peptidase domain-containing protein [Opitutaceae bacterium]|nr:trypsin-like peptidase domain-containing protein [Opitutaceae bacterium]
MPFRLIPSRISAAAFLAIVSVGALAAADETASAPAVPAKAAAVENSVVKVFSTIRYPDPYKPWAKQAPRESTGTGVIIEGKRILTNAHVVLYASQVQVQANQSGDKISATVETIAQGIDLAVLKLDDESFFDSRPPLARATKLPEVKDTVMVYGFPTGGTNLSITKGIVSRIDFTMYNFPTSGLRIQIDAAINPGNSGGPAVAEDKMIGIAFSRLGGGDNIGYIIPCEEVELFLQDAADGRYDGKPAMFDSLQTFENPALRPFLKVGRGVDGMIVAETDSDDPDYPLHPWDIITRIGDTPVDNEGMIKVGNIRVRFAYLIQKLARNGRVPLTVVRQGKELKIELPVFPRRPMVIPDLDGSYPSYFVYGPLVFSKATQLFLAGLNNAASALSAMASPLATRRGDRPSFPGEGLVVVSSPFFPHKLSKGYSQAQSRVVDKVNGITIKNLEHLVATLRDLPDEFVVFDFGGRKLETLVFPRQEMAAATEEILNDNGVRAQGSPDTFAVWNAAKVPNSKLQAPEKSQ